MLDEALMLFAVGLLFYKELARFESSLFLSSLCRAFASLIAWISTSGDPNVLSVDNNLSYSRSWDSSRGNTILFC